MASSSREVLQPYLLLPMNPINYEAKVRVNISLTAHHNDLNANFILHKLIRERKNRGANER